MTFRAHNATPPEGMEEEAFPLMRSMADDAPAIYLANVLNGGAVDGIQKNVAFEIPAELGGNAR